MKKKYIFVLLLPSVVFFTAGIWLLQYSNTFDQKAQVFPFEELKTYDAVIDRIRLGQLSVTPEFVINELRQSKQLQKEVDVFLDKSSLGLRVMAYFIFAGLILQIYLVLRTGRVIRPAVQTERPL